RAGVVGGCSGAGAPSPAGAASARPESQRLSSAILHGGGQCATVQDTEADGAEHALRILRAFLPHRSVRVQWAVGPSGAEGHEPCVLTREGAGWPASVPVRRTSPRRPGKLRTRSRSTFHVQPLS